MNTQLSHEAATLAEQLDANPGLWIRLHGNAKSFVLRNVVEKD